MAELTFWEWWASKEKGFWESFNVMKPMLPQIKEIAKDAWMTASGGDQGPLHVEEEET
jgi:hypothetical protein